MSKTEIRFNLAGLDEFKKKFGNSYRARVGILGAKAARTDVQGSKLNNAELGAIQLFGSLTNNIPPRDFLLMPIQRGSKELLKAMTSSAVKAAFRAGNAAKVFGILGVKAEELVQDAFDTRGFGQWPPNKPATIKRKGSDAPLIDTGQLRRAITSDVVKKGSAGT